MYLFQSALHRQRTFYIHVLNNLQKLSGDSIRLGQRKLLYMNQAKHALLLFQFFF